MTYIRNHIRASLTAACMLVAAAVFSGIGLSEASGNSAGHASRAAQRAPHFAKHHPRRTSVEVRRLLRARARARALVLQRSARVQVAEVLTRNFHVFSSTRPSAAAAASRSLPTPAAVSLASEPVATPNVAMATYVKTQRTGVWVVPGSTGACLLDASADISACNSSARVSADGLIIGTGDPQSHEIGSLIGLVPNGNSRVVVTSADGHSQAVPVTNNVYYASGSDLTAVTFDSAGGSTTKVTLGPTG